MSKSRGNFLDPNDFVAAFGPDGARYVALREVPFDRDAEVSLGLVRAPLQRRPRQRLRQPRQPDRLDDQPLPRRGAARRRGRRPTRRSPRPGPTSSHATPARLERLPAPRRARRAVGRSSARPTSWSTPSSRGTSPRPPRPATRTRRTRLRDVLGDLVEACRLRRPRRRAVPAGDRAARARPARLRLPVRPPTATAARRSSTSWPGARHAGEAGRVDRAGAALPAPRRRGEAPGPDVHRPDAPDRQPLPPQRRPVRRRRRPRRRRRAAGRRRADPRPGLERRLVRARARARRSLPVARRRRRRPSARRGQGRRRGWAPIAAGVRRPRVVAIGETGLDYDRVFSPIPDQLANLRRNLALALETGKPAILHCRSADGRRDAQDALRRRAARGRGRRPAGPPRSASGRRRSSTRTPGPLDYGRHGHRPRAGGQLLGARLPGRRGGVGRGRRARPGRSAAGRDRFAVPVAARRAALAQRTGVGPRHRGVAGRAAAGHARGSSAPRSSPPTTGLFPSPRRTRDAHSRATITVSPSAACSSPPCSPSARAPRSPRHRRPRRRVPLGIRHRRRPPRSARRPPSPRCRPSSPRRPRPPPRSPATCPVDGAAGQPALGPPARHEGRRPPTPPTR